jgi:hypothetical protein
MSAHIEKFGEGNLPFQVSEAQELYGEKRSEVAILLEVAMDDG